MKGKRRPPVPQAVKVKSVWVQVRRSVLWGAGLLLVYAAIFALYLRGLPKLSDHDVNILRKQFPPKTLPELVVVRDVAVRYSATNPVIVAVGICLIYIMMQTFAVPGTLPLTILCGAIFGMLPGLALVTVWPSKLESFKQEVVRQQSHIFNYVVFLRLTPVLPNVFINVASPIVDVPLHHFFWGTFFGCIPNNSIAVNAGIKISELKSLNDLYSPQMILFGFAAGCVALLPVMLQKSRFRPHSNIS